MAPEKFYVPLSMIRDPCTIPRSTNETSINTNAYGQLNAMYNAPNDGESLQNIHYENYNQTSPGYVLVTVAHLWEVDPMQ